MSSDREEPVGEVAVVGFEATERDGVAAEVMEEDLGDIEVVMAEDGDAQEEAMVVVTVAGEEESLIGLVVEAGHGNTEEDGVEEDLKVAGEMEMIVSGEGLGLFRSSVCMAYLTKKDNIKTSR